MKFFHRSLINENLDANERTAYQRLELFDETKDKPKSYRLISCNFVSKKLYSALFRRFEIFDYKMRLESNKNIYSFYF